MNKRNKSRVLGVSVGIGLAFIVKLTYLKVPVWDAAASAALTAVVMYLFFKFWDSIE